MFRTILSSIREWQNRYTAHTSLITVEVSRSALLQNLSSIKSSAPRLQLAPALKSNAYGHGLVLVARLLEKEKSVEFFCIDSYFEATLLRHAGIRIPLLIMGYTSTATIQKNRLKHISFVVGSLDECRKLAQRRVRASIHLKFDTGMHRQGIMLEDRHHVIELLKESPQLHVDGVMSHFADAENQNSELTLHQIRVWNGIVTFFQESALTIRYYHIANSAGFGSASEILGNIGRPGLALYGINPGNLNISLVPALRMRSQVASIRTVPKGESVGYNAMFVAERVSRIAVVPAGYFEGIDRRLSNQGVFLVCGNKAPIAGRVSMNMSSCDVSDIPTVTAGSEVLLISHRSEDKNSIMNIALTCQTIPYEIAVHIPAHLYRVLVERF